MLDLSLFVGVLASLIMHAFGGGIQAQQGLLTRESKHVLGMWMLVIKRYRCRLWT